jgi:transposase, IS5 family
LILNKIETHVAPSLNRHSEVLGRAPELYSSDRGFYSEQNLASCERDGVKVVCIPRRGGTRTPESEGTREVQRPQRRLGIEGRISVLFLGRGMKHCPAEGIVRFELWVAAAVLANKLMRIAALLKKPSRGRRKPT